MDIPWWYFLISILIALVIWCVWKKPYLGILIGYSFLIFTETILIRTPFDGEHLQLELFWSWKAWETQRNQVIANVIMFIPVGVFVGCLWKWRGVIFAVVLSVAIELLQLVSCRGLCELDDVLHNSFGAVIGLCITILIKKLLIKEKFE